MGYEFIKVEKKEHVTWLTINRPENMNALHPPGSQEMENALDEFAADPEAWIAVITGAGEKAFSAGNDLKYQAEHGAEALQEGMAALKYGFGGITDRYDCFKPIIAAVNGFALGGGFEIAMTCDIIAAAEHAIFGVPEPKVGLYPGAGGIHRLPRQIPFRQAMGMMLTGRHISAQEALKLGAINEVVPSNDLIPAVERWISQILECAPLAVRACKEGALVGLDYPLEEAIKRPYPGGEAVWNSEDLVEGPRAFAEKRKPNWKGK